MHISVTLNTFIMDDGERLHVEFTVLSQSTNVEKGPMS